MNHSGVFFCSCNSPETTECNLGFPSLHWLQLGDQIKFPQSGIERGIAVGCIKPLQHFLSERDCKLTICKTVIDIVGFAAVKTITALVNSQSKKFLSGHNSSVNKFEMKLA